MTKMSARGRIKLAKALRLRAKLGDQSLDFAVKSNAKFWIDGGIITNRFSQFFVGIRMQDVSHKPAIFRTRARDSSTGMP